METFAGVGGDLQEGEQGGGVPGRCRRPGAALERWRRRTLQQWRHQCEAVLLLRGERRCHALLSPHNSNSGQFKIFELKRLN